MFETLIHQHTDPLRDAYRNGGTREERSNVPSVCRPSNQQELFSNSQVVVYLDNPAKMVICALLCALSEPVYKSIYDVVVVAANESNCRI